MPVRIGPGQTQFTVTPRRAELDGQRPGEPDHAVLRRGVRADPALGAEPFGRGDVHDPPVAVAAQVREARPHEALVGGEVDGDGRVPRRVVGLGVAVERRGQATPALLTRMSIGPSRATTSATTASIAAADATSSAHAAAASSPWTAVISSADGRAAVAVAVGDRDPAPSSARRCAVARPMPDAAPVTRATRPATERERDVSRGSHSRPGDRSGLRGAAAHRARSRRPPPAPQLLAGGLDQPLHECGQRQRPEEQDRESRATGRSGDRRAAAAGRDAGGTPSTTRARATRAAQGSGAAATRRATRNPA